MRTTLLVLIILCSAAAFGQTTAAVISSQPQVLRMTDHPMHADTTPMATEHSLVGGGPSTYTYAQGERPLWEFGPVSEPARPLGDVAREYRKEKQTTRKAGMILEKQGS
ncbi:MAG TPA: hypothetical protein VFA67_01395 [Candidatus Sulfotelmatobacter sp.]|nr:hypothetical protein [Candidatus Sulfotelmatobacter sp.]